MEEHSSNVPSSEETAVVTTNTKPKRKHGSFVRLVFVALLLLVAVAVLIGGVATGKIYAGTKDPGQRVQLQYQVCGSDMVKTYNDVSFPPSDKDMQSMKVLATTIDGKANSIHDPTCQAIRFYVAQQLGDASAMKTALDAIRELHGQGRFIDSELKSSLSIAVMELLVANAQAGKQQ